MVVLVKFFLFVSLITVFVVSAIEVNTGNDFNQYANNYVGEGIADFQEATSFEDLVSDVQSDLHSDVQSDAEQFLDLRRRGHQNKPLKYEVYDEYNKKNKGFVSKPFYPSPLGGRIPNVWQEAYEKARKLVEKMSITEKVNLTTGTGWGSGPCIGNTGGNKLVPPFCIQDGPNGVRFADFVTSFPTGLAAGSTFNRGLMYLRGKAIALEHKRKGVDVVLGPTIGPIGLKAAGGRNWESFGNDPYLEGIAGRVTVEGIQEEGVIACVRHLIGNEQETFRQVGEWDNNLQASISSNIGDRAMHEVYLFPFADAINAGAGSVMCSFNRVNNSYACENPALLNGLLKDELGFQGFVMSDWGAQHTGVYSCLAGLDMTMPGEIFNNWCSGKSYWGPLLTRAVYNQTIPQSRLNDMAVRILAPFFVVGCQDFNNNSPPNFSSWTYHTYGQEFPYAHYGPILQVNWHVDARDKFTEETALQVAREAIVLLKNDGRNLPISPDKGVRRLLIAGIAAGASADGFNCKDQKCVDGVITSGWGSAAVNNPYVITPYEAVARKAIDLDMVVDFTRDSYSFETVDEASDYADMAIVFVSADSGEGYIQIDDNYGDRKNLSLWHNGDELIKHVAERCRKTVVVVNSVGPVNMEKWIDHENVVAVLYAAPLGQFVGKAIAEVLFGDVNPSGRLPFTIARKDDHYVKIVNELPEDGEPQDDFNHDIYLDYKFFDKHNLKPRFEFGYGLSYTSFALSSLKISEIQAPTEFLPRPEKYLSIYKMCEDDICDPEDALFPHDEMEPVPGFIYPYLFNEKIVSVDEFEYPKGYTPDQFNDPPLAGGGLGGNPALWDILYTVKAKVTNTGAITGSYVAQLYVEFPCTHVGSPSRQLRGFDKVKLQPGGKSRVHFDLLRRDLSIWDTSSQQWIIQKGTYKIFIGSSSRKLELCGEIEIETNDN
ncbi:hypothetical protein PACTADRAFT_5293 [Pachysolen tannophilus NRRL Y-2460]|uniref:beta-glucosidase n=1 Tax=Pachysolen tannophilus NRRL Y-2460 TaxID=669874 RepID=A0A1E4TP26_PACTA|nr:hypothetical protein PACTADRAFT_5293 [Pachysolen tannophilus NRRL Y-2460]